MNLYKILKIMVLLGLAGILFFIALEAFLPAMIVKYSAIALKILMGLGGAFLGLMALKELTDEE